MDEVIRPPIEDWAEEWESDDWDGDRVFDWNHPERIGMDMVNYIRHLEAAIVAWDKSGEGGVEVGVLMDIAATIPTKEEGE